MALYQHIPEALNIVYNPNNLRNPSEDTKFSAGEICRLIVAAAATAVLSALSDVDGSEAVDGIFAELFAMSRCGVTIEEICALVGPVLLLAGFAAMYSSNVGPVTRGSGGGEIFCGNLSFSDLINNARASLFKFDIEFGTGSMIVVSLEHAGTKIPIIGNACKKFFIKHQTNIATAIAMPYANILIAPVPDPGGGVAKSRAKIASPMPFAPAFNGGGNPSRAAPKASAIPIFINSCSPAANINAVFFSPDADTSLAISVGGGTGDGMLIYQLL